MSNCFLASGILLIPHDILRIPPFFFFRQRSDTTSSPVPTIVIHWTKVPFRDPFLDWRRLWRHFVVPPKRDRYDYTLLVNATPKTFVPFLFSWKRPVFTSNSANLSAQNGWIFIRNPHAPPQVKIGRSVKYSNWRDADICSCRIRP